jgi:peptidoglycan/LPS O-acetylase OafA/YrhL
LHAPEEHILFGIYRAVLALFVVAQHLLHVPFAGDFAVAGFFILSGYLMTLIMHRTYGYSIKGFLGFVANRALRLYPSYWMALVISAGLILYVGTEVAGEYREVLGIPDSLSGWLQNILMVYMSPFPSDVLPRLSPATWALTIEIVFYVLIGLGVSRSKRVTFVWFGLGLAWHLATILFGMDYTWRYHFIPAGALPFSIGALLYHYHAELTQRIRATTALITCSVLVIPASILLAAVAHSAGQDRIEILATYLNMANNTLLIILLSQLRTRGVMRSIDKFIGDFSYHIYILHWAVGLAWAALVFRLPHPTGSMIGIISVSCAVLTCICISLFLTRFVDEPIEKLRKAIKSGRGAATQDGAKIKLASE